ncbi:MAG: hypothetical protein MUP81_05500 [Dehalococcoidia bacterium]|nr:hypothetical protein [Dehalococcoidia bacterium]
MQISILEYQQRVFTWAAGRTFLYLSSPRISDNPPPCDACGSKRVTSFRLLEDKDGHYLIGGDCFKLLYDKDQITSDAKMNWKNSPYWRDIDTLEKEIILEKTGGKCGQS